MERFIILYLFAPPISLLFFLPPNDEVLRMCYSTSVENLQNTLLYKCVHLRHDQHTTPYGNIPCTQKLPALAHDLLNLTRQGDVHIYDDRFTTIASSSTVTVKENPHHKARERGKRLDNRK